MFVFFLIESLYLINVTKITYYTTKPKFIKEKNFKRKYNSHNQTDGITLLRRKNCARS